MDQPQLIESIPCPSCGEKKLRPGSDGNQAACEACGQLVIFDTENEEGKRKPRNYTPEHHPVPHRSPSGDSPFHPHRHASDPNDHRGPLPRGPAMEEFTATPIVRSHALQTARRMMALKWLASITVVSLVFAAIIWSWLGYETNRYARNSRQDNSAAGSVNPLLHAVVPTGSMDASEIDAARKFLEQKILPATTWQDWLPYIRHRDAVEPLMAAYYESHPFVPLQNLAISEGQPMVNPSGRFATFALATTPPAMAMVEHTTSGHAFDWEILVNYPMTQWHKFLEARPDSPQNLAITLSRCYLREEFLSSAENLQRDQLLGLRIGIPGDPDQLFAAVPLDSDIGRWVIAEVPWEHENRIAVARAPLAFDASFGLIKERVKVTGIPVPGWNR